MGRKAKKTRAKNIKHAIDPQLVPEIIAITLSAFAVLLILAIFGLGGSLPESIFHFLRLIIGYSTYLLPITLGLTAWMLFLPEKFESRLNIYLGFGLFTIFLSGLLHIGVSKTNILIVANAGQGGGIVGYLLNRGLLSILNVPAAAIILVAAIVIALIIAFNAKISDLIKKVLALFKNKENIHVNEAAGFKINTTLPVKGTIDVAGAGKKEDFEALTAGADPNWTLPSLDLLQEGTSQADAGNIKENAHIVEQTLQSFGINVTMGDVNIGPTVAQYTFKPSEGVKLTKITGLSHNLALALAAHPIRIEAPIPGKSLVGIEVPHKSPALVRLKNALETEEVKKEHSPLGFVLGSDVSGVTTTADLAKMPHLLIAGATGSGKSVMINSLILSLLYRNSPSDLKLILVDPKRVELSLYNEVPHLLAPVIVEPEKCISALKWATAEMERRYKLFADVSKRNISEYNASVKGNGMPYVIIVIDELADLMSIAAQDVEALIVRLAQMARATGIHLVLSTQRPSVNVITGLIKANIQARIAFSVASQVDSRTILDQSGADKLLGRGDMLFVNAELPKPKRIQGVWVSEKEVRAVTDFLRKASSPLYNEEVLTQPVRISSGRTGVANFESPDDDMFDEAAEVAIKSGKASASLLQRRLRIGYARAARLIDLMEERGIVGPADGARPRDVLVSNLNKTSDEDSELE